MSLDWIYWAISWILLKWHSAWDALGVGTALGTSWDWILAIVFLVVTLRVVLFPVFVKQIKSQRAMQALQPQVKALQDKHKGDRETLQKEMMELYRKEKANPLMGCLPMFLQIPVFIGLFHVLRRLDPNKNPELYGWTTGQFRSAVDATLFTAPIPGKFGSSAEELARLGVSSGTVVKVIAGVLVLIMMVTTYLTSRQMILKTGWAEDPQQKMIQRLMLYGIPLSLLISGAIFPIGVIIYWVTNNLFTLGQQQWVLRKFPPPPMAAGASSRTGSSSSSSAASRRNGATAAKSPVQPAKGGGLLGRRKPVAEAEPAKPVIDGKALAPKPGAKPANPKKGGGGAKPAGGAKPPAKPPAKRQG